MTATLRAALGGRANRRACATRPAASAGFKRPRTDVGVTHTDAIHYFDLFAHLLGREATRVSALQRDFLGRGLDDMSLTTVTYGDVPVIVEANYFVPGTPARVRDRRRARRAGRRLRQLHRRRSTWASTGERGGAWEAVDDGQGRAGRDADPSRCGSSSRRSLPPARGHGANPVPAEAGVHALEIVEAAARAARLGRDGLDRRDPLRPGSGSLAPSGWERAEGGVCRAKS